jgi:hypothetical protein
MVREVETIEYTAFFDGIFNECEYENFERQPNSYSLVDWIHPSVWLARGYDLGVGRGEFFGDGFGNDNPGTRWQCF